MDIRLKIPVKKLTTNQKEIMQFVFRFRHLQLPQVQQLLGKKYNENTRVWLKDLTERKYLFRIYEKEIARKPSEYCLDKGSIPYFRKMGVSERILKGIYAEKTNSQEFREQKIFLAHIYLSLTDLTRKTNSILHFYTQEEMENLQYLILPHPDCYFAIQEESGIVERYFLDIFDNDFMYKRFHQYKQYYKLGYWQQRMNKPFPKVLFITKIESQQNSLYRFMQRKPKIQLPLFYVSSWRKIETLGMRKDALKQVL